LPVSNSIPAQVAQGCQNSKSNAGSRWHGDVTISLAPSAFGIWDECSLSRVGTTRLATLLLTIPARLPASEAAESTSGLAKRPVCTSSASKFVFVDVFEVCPTECNRCFEALSTFRSLNSFFNLEPGGGRCVLLYFLKPILADRYGPGLSSLASQRSTYLHLKSPTCQILALHIDSVAGYTNSILFLFKRTYNFFLVCLFVCLRVEFLCVGINPEDLYFASRPFSTLSKQSFFVIFGGFCCHTASVPITSGTLIGGVQ